ncbi:MAG: hypothetical protein Fur0018_10360 [Anaerolineales bacterium]
MRWSFAGMLAAGLAALVLLLSAAANHFTGLEGWPGFAGMALVGGGMLTVVFYVLRRESPPRWLWHLTVLAILLRLGAAVLWFLALPVWGYGNPPEMAGYVMADAYTRDTVAWKLAQSGRPLWDAFGYSQAADQYGGLLFVSAAVYRILGGAQHHALLMAALAALVSALVVPLGWALTKRALGTPPARWTAWGLALYPEAVLLGSSQMREAFGMPLLAGAVYGGVLAGHGETRRGGLWLAVSGLLLALLSPPMAGTAVLFALGTYLGMRTWRPRRVLALVVAAVLIFIVLGGFVQISAWGNWVQKATDYQVYLSRQASGWVQKTFRLLPGWAHLPFLVFYGLLRPLLPAALLAGGAPIWWGVAVWRSLGWTLVLAGLMLAALRVALKRAWLRLPGLWLLLVLAQALVASLRGGGDMWDNPRYRALAAAPQMALAAWALWQQRQQPSAAVGRWLRGMALGALWLVPWYVRRYTPLEWAVVSLFKTLGLALGTMVLYALVSWVQARE